MPPSFSPVAPILQQLGDAPPFLIALILGLVRCVPYGSEKCMAEIEPYGLGKCMAEIEPYGFGKCIDLLSSLFEVCL